MRFRLIEEYTPDDGITRYWVEYKKWFFWWPVAARLDFNEAVAIFERCKAHGAVPIRKSILDTY